jgi:hypothetical protein
VKKRHPDRKSYKRITEQKTAVNINESPPAQLTMGDTGAEVANRSMAWYL